MTTNCCREIRCTLGLCTRWNYELIRRKLPLVWHISLCSLDHLSSASPLCMAWLFDGRRQSDGRNAGREALLQRDGWHISGLAHSARVSFLTHHVWFRGMQPLQSLQPRRTSSAPMVFKKRPVAARGRTRAARCDA